MVAAGIPVEAALDEGDAACVIVEFVVQPQAEVERVVQPVAGLRCGRPTQTRVHARTQGTTDSCPQFETLVAPGVIRTGGSRIEVVADHSAGAGLAAELTPAPGGAEPGESRVLVVFHVGGALKHQFIDKDRELARIGIGRAEA